MSAQHTTVTRPKAQSSRSIAKARTEQARETHARVPHTNPLQRIIAGHFDSTACSTTRRLDSNLLLPRPQVFLQALISHHAPQNIKANELQ